MSDTDLAELLAASLDAEPALLPYLPELLTDLEDLGARSADVLRMLRECRLLRERTLGERPRVLDLGCGKGAVALALAQQFGAHVTGVDGMPAFVEHARLRAAELGVSQRTDFAVGDVRAWAARSTDYDLVLMLALGPIFGDAANSVGVLRRCVKPGGLMLLDDAYLAAPDAELEAELEHCADHATTLARLESYGDRVLAEQTYETEEYAAWLQAMTRKVLARADDLARRYPEHAELLHAFAQRQRQETALLAGPVIGALWLIQVTSGRRSG